MSSLANSVLNLKASKTESSQYFSNASFIVENTCSKALLISSNSSFFNLLWSPSECSGGNEKKLEKYSRIVSKLTDF